MGPVAGKVSPGRQSSPNATQPEAAYSGMFRGEVEVPNNDEAKARLKTLLQDILELARCSGLIAALQVHANDENGLNLSSGGAKVDESNMTAMGLLRAQIDLFLTRATRQRPSSGELTAANLSQARKNCKSPQRRIPECPPQEGRQ